MKNFIISVIFLLSTNLPTTAVAQSLPGHNYPITPDNLKFTYQSHDGEISLKCTHALEDAMSQDWLVTCSDAEKEMQRTYRVHLWVTAYERQVQPKLSLEILYWVTDITRETPVGSSSTIWFHLNDPSSLNSIQISQGVENDTAGLWLEIGW